MKIVPNSRMQCAILVTACGVISAGCSAKTVDLKAVQDFGKTTTAAAQSFDEIAADYYGSCARYWDYRAKTKLGTEPLASIPSHAPFAAMPVPEKSAQPEPAVTDEPSKSSPTPSASLTPLPLLAVGADDRDCKASKALSERWSLENKVLVGYVQALADVAGVATAPSQSSFEGLGAALKGAGAINSDATAKAGGDLAAAIVASLIRRKQEHDVIGLATDARKPVEALTDGLEDAAVAYRAAVRDELSEMNTMRGLLITFETRQLRQVRERAGLPRDSPLEAVASDDFSDRTARRSAAAMHISLAEEQRRLLTVMRMRDLISRQRASWSTDVADAVRRANMASDYFRAVAAIRKTHDALVKTHGGLDAVIVTVKPFVDELSDPVNALITASKQKPK